jgi:large subunit ribosomal protein L13
VVIINAASVKLTGRKEEQKLYRRHSGYEGGLREERAVDVRKRQPVRLVEEAVRGMLPKTKMGDAMYRKLKVYAGENHPHAAQQPQKTEVA